jgi:hypothetical protein
VCCAFSFCWQALLAEYPGQPAPPDPQAATLAALSPQVSHCTSTYRRNQQTTGRLKNIADIIRRRAHPAEGQLLGRQAGNDPVDDLADPAEGIDEQLGAGHGGSCALPGAPPGSGGSSG